MNSNRPLLPSETPRRTSGVWRGLLALSIVLHLAYALLVARSRVPVEQLRDVLAIQRTAAANVSA